MEISYSVHLHAIKIWGHGTDFYYLLSAVDMKSATRANPT